MDLFDKCGRLTTVKETREAGIYPYFHALESRQDVEVMMEGKRRIMLGSNNYLGLTIHPEVVEAGGHNGHFKALGVQLARNGCHSAHGNSSAHGVRSSFYSDMIAKTTEGTTPGHAYKKP